MTTTHPAPPDTDTPLAAVLDTAEARHAGEPAAVMARLAGCAAGLHADDDGARALRLAEHVALGHLGDGAALHALLQSLPPAVHNGTATAATVQRLHWALAQLDSDRPTMATPPPPADAVRWRALQNVVLAAARQGRALQAGAWLAADEAAARAHGTGEAGVAYAACCNNVASHLQDDATAPGAPPDPARDALMLQAATLARRAWSHAGGWLQVERAEYRLAVCHAAAKQGAQALVHAQACLAACEAAGAQADALEHFFAHEALVQSHAARGDGAAVAAARDRMAALLPQVPEADGLRTWCAEVLAGLPAGGA